MTSTYAPEQRPVSTTAKVSGYLAAAMAAGLGITHLTIYTVGFLDASDVALSTYLLGGVAIAAVALVFAAAAALLTWRSNVRLRRTLRAACWVAATVLSLQAVGIALAEPVLLIQPAGPGPWSLVGGPAFAIFLWQSRKARTR
ncbi:hypothetical protein FB561_3908 [Kribbella amoyensis]|uniref:Uncharacterized protein n=1 Tax=Kribbella amoyensis TaxID=996641 RepID=A0A561BV39_9ACTN|nr:hypothetical protein [Kribbella amoyensis]TWD82765.1 hypothetical protein FB561_3908 [Kribbella amoyensis]